MPLSEFELKRIEKLFSGFCQERVPPELHDQIRIEFRIKGDVVTLYESRPHYRDNTTWFSTSIARFNKNPDTEIWQLYYADRNDKWRIYEECPPNRDIEKLLTEVKNDPTCIFWG